MQELKRVLREGQRTRRPYRWLGQKRNGLRVFLHQLFFGRYYTAKYFDRTFTDRPDPWRFQGNSVQEERRGIILGLLKQSHYSRLLEIGCAEGWMTPMLAELCDELISIDISRVALARARQRCAHVSNVTFAEMDLVKDPLPEGLFDCIVCAGVLVFLPKKAQEPVRRKIIAGLQSGGVLLLEHVRRAYPGEVPGCVVHSSFRSASSLTEIHHQDVNEYAITVFRKVLP